MQKIYTVSVVLKSNFDLRYFLVVFLSMTLPVSYRLAGRYFSIILNYQLSIFNSGIHLSRCNLSWPIRHFGNCRSKGSACRLTGRLGAAEQSPAEIGLAGGCV